MADPVTELDMTIPVLSRALFASGAEMLQDGLKKKRWYAAVTPLQTQSKLRVIMRRPGATTSGFGADRKVVGEPFDPDQAKADVVAVAGSLGVKLAAVGAWAVKAFKAAVYWSSGAAVVDVASTAVKGNIDFFQKAKEEADKCKAEGRWFCTLRAAGIPGWVPPVVIGVGLLMAVGHLANIKRTFFG